MGMHAYRLEPAPKGKVGWVVMSGQCVVFCCSSKEEAQTILDSLISLFGQPVKNPSESGPGRSIAV